MELTKFRQEMWKMSEFLFEKDLEVPSYARERYNICRECERFWGGLCKECGCVMAIKTKFKKFSCPLGKWEVVLEETGSFSEDEQTKEMA
tara:strand:+ start:237 stop:506 length:270 start_codon:yes stop_codon:yes gene_type:complete